MILRFLLFLLLPLSCQAATLYLLIAADLESADLGNSAQLDVRRVDEELALVCEELGLPFERHLLIHTEFTPGRVIDAIENLETEPDDIICFFYSGHGFHRVNDSSPWPRFEFDAPFSSLGFETVANVLTAKPARFRLLMADCCNRVEGFPDPGELEVAGSFYCMGRRIRALEALFLQSEGNLLVTSADVGELAGALSNRGGIYTTAFFQTLEMETLLGDGVTWDSLLKRTTLRLEQDFPYHSQHPYWEWH